MAVALHAAIVVIVVLSPLLAEELPEVIRCPPTIFRCPAVFICIFDGPWTFDMRALFLGMTAREVRGFFADDRPLPRQQDEAAVCFRYTYPSGARVTLRLREGHVAEVWLGGEPVPEHRCPETVIRSASIG